MGSPAWPGSGCVGVVAPFGVSGIVVVVVPSFGSSGTVVVDSSSVDVELVVVSSLVFSGLGSSRSFSSFELPGKKVLERSFATAPPKMRSGTVRARTAMKKAMPAVANTTAGRMRGAPAP